MEEYVGCILASLKLDEKSTIRFDEYFQTVLLTT